MEKTNNEMAVLLSVSNYSDVTSINNLILVGMNIEKSNYTQLKRKIKEKEISEIDALVEFVDIYYNRVKYTNEITPLSIEFVDEQNKALTAFKDKLSKIILNADGSHPLLNKKIEDKEYFMKILHICQSLINTTAYLTSNQKDAFTVSTLTVLQILSVLEIYDVNLRYMLMKIVGRRNEAQSSDVDPWLETLEYNYEVYHIKSILDNALEMLGLSPLMLLDLTVYKMVLSPNFEIKYKLEDTTKLTSDEQAEEYFSTLIEGLMDISTETLNSMVNILNESKFSIPSYFMDIFEEEFNLLSYFRIINKSVVKYPEEKNADILEPITVKEYTPYVDRFRAKEYIATKLIQYLKIEGYLTY